MSSDGDEFEDYELSDEEVAEIVEWAVGTSAMVTLMWASPDHNPKDLKDSLERLDGFLEAITIMMDNMPEVLYDPAMVRANEAIEIAEETEEIVENFVKEIEEWEKGDGRT